MTTPFESSRLESAFVSAKAGISVWKRVIVADSWLTGRLNVPWMAVPFEVISVTFPAETCARKSGLKGTRVCAAGLVKFDATQKLRSRSPAKTASTRQLNLGTDGLL